MTGREFLKKYSRKIPYHLDFVVDDDHGAAIGEWLGGDPPGEHRFVGLGYAASGDRWYQWYYPGLEGEPPVVGLGDGCMGNVADTVEAFVRQLADADDHDEEDAAKQADFAALVDAHLPPRSAVPARTHPDFLAFLHAHQRAFALPDPPEEVLLRPWIAHWEAGRRREAADGAQRRLDAEAHPPPPALALVARWWQELGEVDRAVQLLLRARDPVPAVRILWSARRRAEAERLVEEAALGGDRELAPILADMDPAVVRRARARADEKDRFYWEPRFRRTAGLPAKRRRVALLDMLPSFRSFPLAVATLQLDVARTWLEQGNRSNAAKLLDKVRALDVPGAEDGIAALERELAAPPAPAEPAPSPRARRSRVSQRPPDLPIVTELATAMRRTPDDVGDALAAALAGLAGDGAEGRWDGERLHVTRDGVVLDADTWLDAAVDAISR